MTWGISAKLGALLGAGVIASAIIAVVGLSFLRDTMLDDRVDKIQRLSEVAWHIVDAFHERAKHPEFDDETAKENVKAVLRQLRYSEVEYFFIYQTDGTNVLLPGQPENEGKNLIDLKDANGTMVIRGLLDSARDRGKPVRYQFPRAASSVPIDKVAVGLSLEPWGWAVGTGIYGDGHLY